MKQAPPRAAASALKWRAAEQLSVKLLFLARTPILARLLSPDDFGLLAIGLASLDILMRLTELGMIPALVQREFPERRHYDAAWGAGVIRAGVIAACVYFAAPLLASVFGEPRATPIIQVMGLRPLIMALASVGVADLTRNLEFRGLAILRLTDMGVDAVVSIALAPMLGVWALVAGSLAGPLTRLVLSYVLAPHRPRVTFDRAAATSLIRFGRWIFVSGLITLTGGFILQAAIARQLGTTELGLYYLGAKIGYTITEVSADLLGAVAFPWFSRLQSDRAAAERAFQSLLRGLAIVLLPLGGLLAVLAPSIAEHVLGPQWLGAAPVIQIMVAASLLGAFGDAVLPLLRGLGKPHLMALLDLLLYVVLVSLVWEAAGRYGLVGAAGSWIPAMAVTQVAAYVVVRQVLDAPLRGVAGVVAVLTGVTAIGCLLAWGADTMLGGVGGLLVAGVVGTGSILLLLLAADRYWALDIVSGLAILSPRLARTIERVFGPYPTAGR